MATDNDEMYVRYVLLLGKGGKLMLKAILDRETDKESIKSGKTLDVLLQENKVKLINCLKKKDKRMESKLFPKIGKINEEDWDISLFCIVLLQVFETELTGEEIQHIKEIKNLRNKIFHSGETSMDRTTYETSRSTLTNSLIKLCQNVDSAISTKLQNYIKDLHAGPIDLRTALDMIKELQAVTGKIEELFKMMAQKAGKDESFLPQMRSFDDSQEQSSVLFDEYIELCKRNPYRKADNILLIGQVGSGKSSMVNTIFTALTEEFKEIARCGSKTCTVTRDFIRYKSCGIDVSFLEEGRRKEKLQRIKHTLPNIIDIPGLPNEDTEDTREVLELLIGGYIPDRTSLIEVIGKSKTFFQKQDVELKVTKIIFVQGCKDRIPKNLISCLMDVLTMTDPKTKQRKYTPKLFLVLTKCDLIRDMMMGDGFDENSCDLIRDPMMNDGFDENRYIEYETFLEMENETRLELRTDGYHWINYTNFNRRPKHNPAIECNALRFLKILFKSEYREPKIDVETKTLPYLPFCTI